MKSKRLFQLLVLLALVFSSFGSNQQVSASANSIGTLDAMVINRNLDIWDATYIGYVSASVFEKWHLELTEAHSFVVSVSTLTGDLVPLLVLQDANGSEITHGTGSLTTSQPAGSYYIQTQPESGSGFYVLTLRQVVNVLPSVSTSVNSTSLNVGESAVVTVSLNNVPAEGYTSAEFTCTYNAALLKSSNITIADLFGADAATAINDPQNGSFIVAIAGSNGNKATTSGTVFTFTVTALQAGQSAIECTARVSKGDNVLTNLPSTGTSLTIVGTAPTPTPFESPTPVGTVSTPVDTPTPVGTPSTPVDTPTPVETASTPVDTATPNGTPSTPVETATPNGTPSTPVETTTPVESPTPSETPTPVFTATPVESPTPTPLPDGTVTGQVLASKPVTVILYSADNTLAGSTTANPDGTFTLQAPAGTYTIFATASGFLSAQGSVTITGGAASTMPTIDLLAGDIDNNNVIDQFDAMTIGMSYNGADPVAADLNSDGVNNVLDLELLARNYRDTGPVAWE